MNKNTELCNTDENESKCMCGRGYEHDLENNAKNFKVLAWLFGGLAVSILLFTYLAIHFGK
jgi:hypothetical protein